MIIIIMLSIALSWVKRVATGYAFQHMYAIFTHCICVRLRMGRGNEGFVVRVRDLRNVQCAMLQVIVKYYGVVVKFWYIHETVPFIILLYVPIP